MEQKRFSWKERGSSFLYAWNGIKSVLRSEHNTWIHLGFTIVAVALGFILKISAHEFVAIVLSIALVWVTEIVNTAIEKIMDFISLEHHPQIGLVKDLAAAAVLIAAISAVIVGAIIYLPKLF
jgi:diacylglycerol kinase